MNIRYLSVLPVRIVDTYESSKIRLDIYKFMGRYLKPNKPFGSVKELRKAAYKF